MALYFRAPFPDTNLFLHVMAIRSASAFLFFKYSYTLFLYTTPYIVYSVLLSGIYIFALKTTRKVRAGKLPLYPGPAQRANLSLVVGELHHQCKQIPSETPHWLVIPERGLFTGIAIVGAVGSGKTAACMYPFAEQILAYKATDKDRRIGGLILEVKGDFCEKVREILKRHDRLQAIRAAMQECRRNLPNLVERLMQQIEVRSAMAGLNPDKMIAASGGRARHDAGLLRLMARGLEEAKDEEKLAVAAAMWNEFRIQAVREGWFAENGVEAAAMSHHTSTIVPMLSATPAARWRIDSTEVSCQR